MFDGLVAFLHLVDIDGRNDAALPALDRLEGIQKTIACDVVATHPLQGLSENLSGRKTPEMDRVGRLLRIVLVEDLLGLLDGRGRIVPVTEDRSEIDAFDRLVARQFR